MKNRRRLLSCLVLIAAWHAGSGHALGLGELTLQSALNQPMQAIIQLHDSEGLNPSDVLVSLAGAEDFSRSGLERPFMLTDLRFIPAIEERKLIIRVESTAPVKEPYLSFLVQLKRANGRLLREYTVLLDPPLYEPVPIMASSPGARVDTVKPSDEPVSSSTAAFNRPAAVSVTPSLPPPQPGAGRYQTVAGDSLWAIANVTRPDESVSVQQQMDAIGALNPLAFVNGDLSRLRVGQELTLPAVPNPSSIAAMRHPVGIAGSGSPQASTLRGSSRLRIDDPDELQLSEQDQQLHERLVVIEGHLRELLGQLERRDAQIVEAEAELAQVRRTRAAERLAANSGMAVVERQADAGVPAVLAEQGADGAEVIESHAGRQLEEQRESRLAHWWPVPAATLMAVLGALFLRSRREPRSVPSVVAAPAPLPITVPGNRVADPLEGVDLYLAYGRWAEARGMLDKAIAAEPQRLDLRLRLLSVLAGLGDVEGYARLESEVLRLGADQLQIDQIKAHHPHLFARV